MKVLLYSLHILPEEGSVASSNPTPVTKMPPYQEAVYDVSVDRHALIQSTTKLLSEYSPWVPVLAPMGVPGGSPNIHEARICFYPASVSPAARSPLRARAMLRLVEIELQACAPDMTA